MRKTENLAETREKTKETNSLGSAASRFDTSYAHASEKKPVKKFPFAVQKILKRFGFLEKPNAPPIEFVESVILRAVRNLAERNPEGVTFAAVRRIVVRAINRKSWGLPASFDGKAFSTVIESMADPARELLDIGPGETPDERRLSLRMVGKLIALQLPRGVGTDLKAETVATVNDIAATGPKIVRQRQANEAKQPATGPPD
jgi:hypothetical protein